MDVKNIKNPKFLKKLKTKDLELLSQDIRKYIIESVSTTGGHLSSNLGIVDLTIALLKVFDEEKLNELGVHIYFQKVEDKEVPAGLVIKTEPEAG